VRDQLRILWTTKGYTPHAFAAHPRVPPDVVERLNAAMLAIGQDDEGRALLEPLSLPGLERAEDSNWNDVRALGIGLLDDLVKPAQ